MQAQIIAAIVRGVASFSSPITTVAAAAKRNWMKPSKDEAAPAISAKGDMAPAVVPGIMNASDISIRIIGPIRLCTVT